MALGAHYLPLPGQLMKPTWSNLPKFTQRGTVELRFQQGFSRPRAGIGPLPLAAFSSVPAQEAICSANMDSYPKGHANKHETQKCE